MYKTIILISSLLLSNITYGQDTCSMIISAAGLNVGEMKMINFNESNNKQHYRIHSNARLFGFYQVEYKLEAWYSQHKLDSSFAYYKINKHIKHQCTIHKSDTIYLINRLNEVPTSKPMNSLASYCQLFFNKKIPLKRVYSEYDGETKTITYTNDSTFQIRTLNNRLEATYFYTDSMIAGGHINHALLKFNIRKK